MGLGAGLVFSPCTTAVGIHFRRRRSLAVGISLTGSSVGAVAFPIGKRPFFFFACMHANVSAYLYHITMPPI